MRSREGESIVEGNGVWTLHSYSPHTAPHLISNFIIIYPGPVLYLQWRSFQRSLCVTVRGIFCVVVFKGHLQSFIRTSQLHT